MSKQSMEDQGMLFAPQDAAYNTVEGEAGALFYADLEAAMTPEQVQQRKALEAENEALDMLSLENRALGNITHAQNLSYALRSFSFAEAEKAPDVDIEAVNRSADVSNDARRGNRLGAKGSFAESIGIEVETREQRIVAKESSEQKLLDEAYQEFRNRYFGKPKLINRRRKEIQTQVVAMYEAVLPPRET